MTTQPGQNAARTSELRAGDLKIAIVVSRFNDFITEKLLQGAEDAWNGCGGDASTLVVARVPGAFELPITAQTFAQTKQFDAVVCLGCVIRGETDHYDYVCSAAAEGVLRVGLDTGVPVIFGVLTTDTVEQAEDRAGGAHGNKGADAIFAAIETATVLERIRAQ